MPAIESTNRNKADKPLTGPNNTYNDQFTKTWRSSIHEALRLYALACSTKNAVFMYAVTLIVLRFIQSISVLSAAGRKQNSRGIITMKTVTNTWTMTAEQSTISHLRHAETKRQSEARQSTIGAVHALVERLAGFSYTNC